jgi:hypothetical protein
LFTTKNPDSANLARFDEFLHKTAGSIGHRFCVLGLFETTDNRRPNNDTVSHRGNLSGLIGT